MQVSDAAIPRLTRCMGGFRLSWLVYSNEFNVILFFDYFFLRVNDAAIPRLTG